MNRTKRYRTLCLLLLCCSISVVFTCMVTLYWYWMEHPQKSSMQILQRFWHLLLIMLLMSSGLLQLLQLLRKLNAEIKAANYIHKRSMKINNELRD